MLFTDQLGHTIDIPVPPQRIVSVVPSQTELLHDLGASVIGITKFCVHPEAWFRSITRIGGTKQLNIDLITSLQPDLIIANKEENEKAQIDALAARFPVWTSDIQHLEDACNMILSIGGMLQRTQEANTIAVTIKERFARLKPASTAVPTAYFIWRAPWMVAGGDTFIHEMMHACGFRNVFEDIPRYPSVSLAQLAASGCRLVLLSSEPFPFKEKHVAEIRAYLPDADIRLVDGEMFSWYGSRLLQAPSYFQELINSL